jgi:hypothetical protein
MTQCHGKLTRDRERDRERERDRDRDRHVTRSFFRFPKFMLQD